MDRKDRKRKRKRIKKEPRRTSHMHQVVLTEKKKELKSGYISQFQFIHQSSWWRNTATLHSFFTVWFWSSLLPYITLSTGEHLRADSLLLHIFMDLLYPNITKLLSILFMVNMLNTGEESICLLFLGMTLDHFGICCFPFPML